jgi:hypothetical protein
MTITTSFYNGQSWSKFDSYYREEIEEWRDIEAENEEPGWDLYGFDEAN